MQPKPPSTSDMLCPWFRKPMRKVCHTCEMWEDLPVQRIENAVPTGHVVLEWGCTFKNQTKTLRTLLASIDGVQKATESFRNTAWNDSQKNLEALIDVVGSAERTIHAAKQVFEQLPPGSAPLLINGKSSR